MARVQVGDVARISFRWGQRPASVHHKCPQCGGFLKRGVTTCTNCGTSFDYVSRDLVQVVGHAAP